MRLSISTAIISTAIFAALAGCSPSENTVQGEDSTAKADGAIQSAIGYDVVEQWALPNGGFGKAIFIDPVHRNERDMMELAKALQRDTANERNAFVFIFDDRQAALNRKQAFDGSLGFEALTHHDKHLIASYQRNANTGHHGLTLTLQGLNGPATDIGF